ncbi:glycoside hydrolase family protein [Brenneria sp. g21c3]|uniref:glycoside hydrolase family protein n=1 Tax=Brenneria sp. g21c3 TaxID=3093893 RepID=UPI002EA0CD2C|nr:glycoside hydrolase family protein [Brenneria sp. g21c3]
MKKRSPESIKNTMISIGLDARTAEKISKAAGLQNNQASEFATNNQNMVKLTEEQETQRLRVTVPRYVTMVRNGIFVPLRQYEFDALVSFAYNPGERFSNVCDFINQGQISDAMTEIKRAITSRGTVMTGLVNRRNYEVNLYLNGIHGA